MAKSRHVTDRAARKLRRSADKVSDNGSDTWGPSTNPATNLIVQDLILRSVGRLTRQSVEKGLLRKRYGGGHAKNIVENRSLVNTLLAYGATKVATRNLPGALLVGAGLFAKTVYDRSMSKSRARRAGDRQLDDFAEE